MPAKRVKDKPASAEGLNDKDVNQLLGIIEAMEGNNGVPQQEPEHAEDNERQQLLNENTVVKAEVPDVEDPHATVPRAGMSVQFKTSSGRVLTAENQPASVTYGDFRKLFGITANGSKRIIFKKGTENINSSDQWVVAVDDGMKLPLIDGCIVAEICMDT